MSKVLLPYITVMTEYMQLMKHAERANMSGELSLVRVGNFISVIDSMTFSQRFQVTMHCIRHIGRFKMSSWWLLLCASSSSVFY